MFYDEVKIALKAGKGGDGAASFRREKFIPFGGPDGGDGGKGGDVVLEADENQGDLRDHYFQSIRRAGNGEGGQGRQKSGKAGEDCVVRVPPGTLARSVRTGKKVAEVLVHGERVVLLKGGDGGLGNLHFKSSTNQAPRQFTPGAPPEEGEFVLELKTIADLGLVGFPNAGKSSLINLLTRVQAKTAPYPFTTLSPNVGVIEYTDPYDRLTLADIPGLIEGASENKGLGHQFLRHIERCRLLLVILDMAGTDGRDPHQDYKDLLAELKAYDPAMLDKPRLIIANKLDVEASAEHLKNLKKKLRREKIVPLSCATQEGLPELRALLRQTVRGLGAPVPGIPGLLPGE